MEFPVVFGLIGAAAIPSVAAFIWDQSNSAFPAATAIAGIKEIARRNPACRDECIEILSRLLERRGDTDPALNGFAVSALIDLEAVEAIDAIRDAFRHKSVDISIAGDEEDVEIALRLRERRATPAPRYQLLPAGRLDGWMKAGTPLSPPALSRLVEMIRVRAAAGKNTRSAASHKRAFRGNALQRGNGGSPLQKPGRCGYSPIFRPLNCDARHILSAGPGRRLPNLGCGNSVRWWGRSRSLRHWRRACGGAAHRAQQVSPDRNLVARGERRRKWLVACDARARSDAWLPRGWRTKHSRARHGVICCLRGRNLSSHARQQQRRLGRGQTQVGDIIEIAGPVDLQDVRGLLLTPGADFYQPHNPAHASTP